jgi:hypothetical protein
VPARVAALLLAVLTLAAPAAAAPRWLGAQAHPLWAAETDTDMDHDVALLAQLGVDAVRIDVGWSSLQSTGPGEYDAWYVAKLDRFVGLAHARGIAVIATLTDTPCWASTAPASLKHGCAGSWWDRGVTKYAPSQPQAYARVARYLTARYGTRLAALEIYNEPNLSYEFKGPDKAARYAALVRATYPQAKAGNRHVPVLAGAMSYSDTRFLGALYANGIKGFYDGISLHPYSDGRPPLDTDAPAKYEFASGVRSIRDAQALVGDTKPLWLTEFGYTACDASPCVTPAAQADLLRQTLLALPALPYVRGASVYELRDMVDQPSAWEENFGLVRNDFTKRPAFAAVRQALATLR